MGFALASELSRRFWGRKRMGLMSISTKATGDALKVRV
jgi:hypothetical protein